MSEDTPE